MTYYGPKEFENYAMAFWYPSEWLHSDWSYDKQVAFNDLYNFSILGWSPFRNEFDRILDKDNDARYMERNMIDWSDVIDPRKLSQARSGSRYDSINFVSRNVTRLYRGR